MKGRVLGWILYLGVYIDSYTQQEYYCLYILVKYSKMKKVLSFVVILKVHNYDCCVTVT